LQQWKSQSWLSFYASMQTKVRWESNINIWFGIPFTLKPNMKLTTRISCFQLWSVIFQIGNLYVDHLCIYKFELHFPFLIYLLSDMIYISFERNINFNFGNTKTTGGFTKLRSCVTTIFGILLFSCRPS
jgi:hypothetical protein